VDIQFHDGGDEGVFIVETTAPAGKVLVSHRHDHAHMSVLVSGTADVTIDGRTERMTGYRMVSIPANTQHKVAAVTNVIWLCLWADHLAPKEKAVASLKLVAA
jgi:quercetin dioxygenase-like cupin family protein